MTATDSSQEEGALQATEGQTEKWQCRWGGRENKGSSGQVPLLWFPREGTCESGEARLGLAGLNHLSGPGVWGLSLIIWYLALG